MLRIALFLALAVASSSAAEKQEPAEKTEKQLVALGKKIFLRDCAECHNAAGDKPLEAGEPLNVRLMRVDDMRANIGGRLPPDAPAEQKRAVELYIRTFNKNIREVPTRK
ncbi:MAG: hypothetical protein R2762_00555 [Bryobacteraceae bacterium]